MYVSRDGSPSVLVAIVFPLLFQLMLCPFALECVVFEPSSGIAVLRAVEDWPASDVSFEVSAGVGGNSAPVERTSWSDIVSVVVVWNWIKGSHSPTRALGYTSKDW